MIYYFLLILIASIIFIFNQENRLIQTPITNLVWNWDKKNQIDVYGLDTRITEKDINFSPYKSLPGYFSISGKPFLFSNRKIFQSDENELYDLPTLGNGFLSYKKIGDKITYFSKNGEVLWKKNYQSYPFSTPLGKIIYLVSGDGNQVLIIDFNGNPSGVKQLDGRFLTDISNSLNFGSLILFSGGEYYRLDSQGNMIFKSLENKTDDFRFFKSSSISENGEYVGLHYNENDSDYINILKNNESIFKYKLDKIYPHKIFFSISNSGEISINLRDQIIFLSNRGELLKQLNKKKEEEVYQLNFCNGEIFIVSMEDYLRFYSTSGELFYKIKGFPPKQRIFLNKSNINFFLESSQSIIQIHNFKE